MDHYDSVSFLTFDDTEFIDVFIPVIVQLRRCSIDFNIHLFDGRKIFSTDTSILNTTVDETVAT